MRGSIGGFINCLFKIHGGIYDGSIIVHIKSGPDFNPGRAILDANFGFDHCQVSRFGGYRFRCYEGFFEVLVCGEGTKIGADFARTIAGSFGYCDGIYYGRRFSGSVLAGRLLPGSVLPGRGNARG